MTLGQNSKFEKNGILKMEESKAMNLVETYPDYTWAKVTWRMHGINLSSTG